MRRAIRFLRNCWRLSSVRRALWVDHFEAVEATVLVVMPEPLNLSTPLAYALAYARIGWHVFLVEANAKTPLGWLVPRGMLTPPPTRRRSANVAPGTAGRRRRGAASVRAGTRSTSTRANGGDATFEQLQASHGSLRSDVMAMTRRRRRTSRLRHPARRAGQFGTLGPGVDVKANGYIVVEPSIPTRPGQGGTCGSSQAARSRHCPDRCLTRLRRRIRAAATTDLGKATYRTAAWRASARAGANNYLS